MSDIEFVNGLMVKAPHERAPDFVKASISIKVAELKEWLQGRSEEWVNLDVKEAKSGKWYAAVSQYKREEKAKPAAGGQRAASPEDDIPFAPIGKGISGHCV